MSDTMLGVDVLTCAAHGDWCLRIIDRESFMLVPDIPMPYSERFVPACEDCFAKLRECAMFDAARKGTK